MEKITTHFSFTKKIMFQSAIMVLLTGLNPMLYAQSFAGKSNENNRFNPAKSAHISTTSEQWSKGGRFYGFQPSQELTGKRTQNSKYFLRPDGNITAQIGAPMHYKDNLGIWQNINENITVENGLPSYGYGNLTNNIKSYFTKEAGIHGVSMELGSGTKFQWWQKPSMEIIDHGVVSMSLNANNTIGKNQGKKITYSNIYPGISEEFEVIENGLENSTIIHQLPPAINSLIGTEMVSFNQFIPLHSGWKVLSNGQPISSDFDANTFSIQMNGEKDLIYFGNIVVFDNAISKEDALLINMSSDKLSPRMKQNIKQHALQLNYHIVFVGGGIKISAILPSSWLKDNIRSFPVTIDPVVTITPTGSAGSFYGPMTHWYGYQRNADLYLQSEIGGFGDIVAIEYNATDASTSGNKPTKVYMRTTSSTTLSSAAWNSASYTGSGAQLCLDANTDQGSTAGWKMLTLTTPFSYTSDNLIIMVYDAYGGSGSSKYYNQSGSTTTTRRAYIRQDNSDPGDAGTATSENKLQEIRITYNFATPCTGQPSAGTIPATLAVCPAIPFSITATGSTAAGNMANQWQSRTPAGTGVWTDLTGFNYSNFSSAGISVPTDFRYISKCITSGLSDTSGITAVSINAPNTCYCIPSTTSSSFYINDFSTTGGLTNVNNLGSGYSPGGYGNFTALTPGISQIRTGTVTFNATYLGSTFGTKVWVDWNQNGSFSDPGEQVFVSSGTYTANASGSFTVPITALSGNTRIRIGVNYLNATGPANPCESFSGGEYEDYNFFVIPSAPNNAGLISLTSPLNFCAGSTAQPIKVKVKNYGSNMINSVKVFWQMNGVAQTTYNLTTPLDTINGVGINEIEVTLGSYVFSTAPVSFKAWTSLPNSLPDTANYNDTLTKTLKSSLSGTYTINSAVATGGMNFQSFNDFSTTLGTYGVCGPVVANVVGGPFIEKVSFGNINGANSTNTIRINGNGNTVQFTNTATDRQLLTLNGTKYLTIDSLTFKSLATDYGWAALITNNAAYDSITNCFFDLTSVTSISSVNNNGITFSSVSTSPTSAGTNGSHCYIGNNHLKWSDSTGGGYYGLTINGASDSNVIENNDFENYYFYGTYINGSTGTKVIHNKYHKDNKTGSLNTFYGIYTTGITPGVELRRNKIYNPGGLNGYTGTFYGIAFYGDGTLAQPCIVANNLIYKVNQNGLLYGMYVSTAPYTSFYHNTIVFDQALASTGITYGLYLTGVNTNTNIKNNNIVITAGTTGAKYGFYYNAMTSINDAQKNNIYVNSTQAGVQNYGYLAAAFTTQAAFQTANPLLEVGSPAVNPMFVNAAIGDFNVQSPALIGAGVNLLALVPNDINGMPRSASPTIGAFEQAPSGSNNAGLLSFITPTGMYCPGSQSVSVSINNAGINNITSLKLNWTLNGVLQPQVTYSGTIVPVTSSIGQNSDTVTLGNANIPSGSPTVIKAWSSLPNGIADVENANDTISLSFQATQFLVVAASDTVCFGSNANLSLTPNSGYSVGDLQWQSSPNGTTWTSIPSTDAPVYSPNNVTTNSFYRAKFTHGTNTCYSDSASVAVVSVSLLSTTAGNRCGTGTVNLSATGSAGTVINWYSQALGGVPIGTGSSFTTPSISATTTYYASAVLGGGSGLVTVGAGASTSVSGSPEYSGVSPFSYHYGNYKHQLLFTASELAALGMTAGEISSIAFDIANAGSPAATFNNFAISMKQTSATAMVANFETGLTPLFSGNIVPTVGLNTFTFTAPFIWDGVSNIIVQTCYNNNNSGVVASSAEVKYDLTTIVSHTVYRVDGVQNSICDALAGNTGNDGPTSSKRPKVVFDYSGGCESPRTAVIATLKPSPVVNLGNDTTICPGATITLNAGNPGNSYLWSNNTTAQTLAATIAGTYSVKVTGSNTCSKSDTIVITAGIVPLNNLPATTDLCVGDTATLDAGNTGSTYLWSNAATTQTTHINAAGSYNVLIKSSTGCSLTSNTTVTSQPLPLVNLGVDTAICSGDQIVLNAGNPGMNYLWNTGVNTQTISISTAGTYSVIVTSAFNCKGKDTVVITTLPLPTVDAFSTVDLSAQAVGKMQFNAVNPQNVTTYDWNFGDGSTHSSDPSPIHTFTSNGTFTVTLTVSNGCGEDSVSFTVTIEGVGIAQVDKNGVDFTLYPNPTRTEIIITNKSTDAQMQQISIVNVLGSVVFEKVTNGDKVQKVDVSKLASGLYTARILTDKGLVIRKFEVIK